MQTNYQFQHKLNLVKMNSLNLRVSTVKTGENAKKNSEMRSSLVCLPKHYEKSIQNQLIVFSVYKI